MIRAGVFLCGVLPSSSPLSRISRTKTALTIGLVLVQAICLALPMSASAGPNPNAKLAVHLVASDQYLNCDDLIASATLGINPDLSMSELAASGYQGYAVFLAYDLNTCITGVEYYVTGWPMGGAAPAFYGPEYCPPMSKTLCLGQPFEALGGEGAVCAFEECIWESSSEIAAFAYISFDLSGYGASLPITLDYGQSSFSYPADPHNYVLGPPPDFAEDVVVAEHGCVIGGELVYEEVYLFAPNGGEILCTGEEYVIEWSSLAVDDVRIELSLDAGATWDDIVSSTASTGSYIWTVPEVMSENCLVRISDAMDGDPSDVSNSAFTIAGTGNIEVLAPNGGEIWQAGTTQMIEWSSTCVENVRIEYSANGGSTWEEIVSPTQSLGTYLWTIPEVESANCLVRISDAEDGNPVDASDAPFEIRIPEEEAIVVLVPNGGESWEVGTTHEIQWMSAHVENVNIEYSLNSGGTWHTIVGSTPSTGSYSWIVPNQTSDDCLIRISDAEDSVPSDTSDAPFEIWAPPVETVTVLVPNGGEIWMAGSTQVIEWTSNNVSLVCIEYSLDNGATWNVIVDSATSTGSYSWEVPNDPAPHCRVRISDAEDHDPSDMSDGPFMITGGEAIIVLAPNGGELWPVGSNQTIQWNSSNIAAVALWYSTDDGSSWSNIVASTSSTGSYVWTVPDDPSTSCRVRVVDAEDGDPLDDSDGPFTIARPVPEVSFAMHLVASDQYLDCAALTPADPSAFDPDLSMAELAATGYSGYVVFVAYELSDCITGVEYAVGGWPTGRGAPVFSGPSYCPSEALCLGEPFLALGGEGGICGFGDCVWNPTGQLHAFSYIFFDLSAHTHYLPMRIRYEPSSYSYPADPHNYVLGGGPDFQERPVAEQFDCVIGGDISQDPYITVLSPNGYEGWCTAAQETIRWESEFVYDVRLEYSNTWGYYWETIEPSIPNTGFYVWTVPLQPTSYYCLVKVSDAADGVPVDESDQFFCISLDPLTFLAPSPYDDSVHSPEPYEIRWMTCVEVENVRIELSFDGITWEDIIASTPNTGTYMWTVPDVGNDVWAWLRISDAADGDPWAEINCCINCGWVRVEPTTWGGLKDKYRKK